MRRHRRVFGVGEDAGFDEARFVITNAYTGGSDNLKKSFDVAPKHRDEAYNDFCREQLDYSAATTCCSSAGSISEPRSAS